MLLICNYEGCTTSVRVTIPSIPRDGDALVHCAINGSLTDHDSTTKWCSRQLRELALKELSCGKGPVEVYEDLTLQHGEQAPSIDSVKKLNCRIGLSGLPDDQIQQLRLLADVYSESMQHKVKGFIQVIFAILYSRIHLTL